MGENFLGEIRIFPYSKIPTGWHACDGTLLLITSNQALYSLLSIQFGGDGKTTFGLPDLRGRVPLCTVLNDKTYKQGVVGGANGSVLKTENLIPHTHTIMATNADANSSSVAGNLLAIPVDDDLCFTQPAQTPAFVPMASAMLGTAGGSQPVNNMQPYLGLVLAIATQGLYPTRN